MKIRRTSILDAIRDALNPHEPPLSPEEELIEERDERHRQWRNHLYTYLSVNAGLIAMNLAMAVFTGALVPWSIFPLLGWGIGLGIHTLQHQAWLRDEAPALSAAEAKLGIAPVSTAAEAAGLLRVLGGGRPALPPPATRGQLRPGVAAEDDRSNPWPSLLAACARAVERAQTVLSQVHPAATSARTDLTEGLANVERLAEGAGKIREVLAELAPGGRRSLDRQIATLDGEIRDTGDERLREVRLANRALLLARKAKIAALEADCDRMLAKARGFLLAVENLHLDAARVGQHEDPDALSAPIDRLGEEVQILRRVERELGQLR